MTDRELARVRERRLAASEEIAAAIAEAIPPFVRAAVGWMFRRDDLESFDARWRVITAFIGVQILVSLGVLIPFYALTVPDAFPAYLAFLPLVVAGIAMARQGREVLGQTLVTISLYTAMVALMVGSGGAASPAAVVLTAVPTIPMAVRHDRLAVVWVAGIVVTLWALSLPAVASLLPAGAVHPSFAPWAEVWFVAIAAGVVIGGMAQASESSLHLAHGLAAAVEELRHTTREAQAANEAKSLFLASMSHEIRTPMNGVLGTARLLALTELDDEQRAHLRTMELSASALLGILDDVIEVSRIESGVLPIRDDDVDLARLLEVVVASGRAGVGDRPIVVRGELDDAPPWVRTDPSRLRQVLMNLVSNAAKYTERGEVVVRAGLAPDAAPDRLVLRFTVSDTGVGIPERELDTIFERFTRGEGHVAGHIPGTGLGLSIVRTIVSALDGHVSVRSTVGVGSTFTVDLPVQACAEPAAAASADAPPTLHGIRVLVVEDNLVNQRVACALLARFGCDVWHASDGAEGVAAAMATRFDVVLMDCAMPVMNGFDATRVIRTGDGMTPRDVPVIALTADVLDATRLACARAGMTALLLKPTSPDALAQAIAVVMGRAATPSAGASFLLRVPDVAPEKPGT